MSEPTNNKGAYDDDRAWFSGPAECRICGHTYHAVWPAGTDSDRLECPECGHNTVEVDDCY